MIVWYLPSLRICAAPVPVPQLFSDVYSLSRSHLPLSQATPRPRTHSSILQHCRWNDGMTVAPNALFRRSISSRYPSGVQVPLFLRCIINTWWALVAMDHNISKMSKQFLGFHLISAVSKFLETGNLETWKPTSRLRSTVGVSRKVSVMVHKNQCIEWPFMNS